MVRKGPLIIYILPCLHGSLVASFSLRTRVQFSGSYLALHFLFYFGGGSQ